MQTMPGKIVTFYSFKGGVGRSMALANVAWILAANNHRVLAIDWDLEAPGLHHYFRPFLNDKELEETPGLIDMIWDYSDLTLKPRDARPPGLEDPKLLAHAQSYITPLEFPYIESTERCLHFMGAGKQDLSYASRVRKFDWNAFYERLGGGKFLDTFREQLKKQYNFILIDSRTGLTDISGICTVHMPDCVALCFNHNRQNIRGTAYVAQSILDQRPGEEVELLLVPIFRLQEGAAGLNEAKRFARESLDRFLKKDRTSKEADEYYWAKIKVSYWQEYALQETLAVFSEESPIARNTMLSDMQWLAGKIREGTPGEFKELLLPQLEKSVRNKYFQEFALYASKKPPEPYCVPSLPSHYQRRSSKFDQLKATILDASNRVIGVYGTAGVGKSMLVADLAQHCAEIRQAFADGIYWLTFGPHASVTAKQIELILALGVYTPVFNKGEEGSERLADLTRSRACLVILDDVRYEEQAQAFTGLGQRCRLLITIRDQEVLKKIGASGYPLDSPGAEQGIELLAQRIKQPVAEFPPEAYRLAKECDYLPLSLVVLGALIRGAYIRQSQSEQSQLDWQGLLDRLHSVNVQSLGERLKEYKNLPESLLATLEISVEDLPQGATKEAFLDCAVFPENVAIPEATLQMLWSERFPAAADKAVNFFVEQALMRRDNCNGKPCYYLHGLYHHYLYIQKEEDLTFLHQRLLDTYQRYCNYDWASGPNDGYFFQYLPYHLAKAGKNSELHDLLLNYNWLAAKLRATNIQAVIADYMNYAGNDEHTARIQQVLWSSAHVLFYDFAQLPSQLFNGLRERGWSDTVRLLKDSCSLKFSNPKPPSCDEQKTFTGHDKGVHAVAVTPDGRWAVSGSYDETLKLWDLETGIPRTTFRGHTGPVYAVAVIQDGKRVISGSADQTLRIWELETGALNCTLGDHTDKVYAVAVLPDGRRAISGSRDCTLRLWDLDNHRCLATFDATRGGHRDIVYTVDVTPDGRYALSGSRDCTLKLWNLTSGHVERPLKGHQQRVLAVKVLPDGWRALSSSSDCTLKLWDLDSGDLIRPLYGHTDHIFAVVLLPDGRRAISGSCDRSLRLWDLDTGESVILGYHSKGINAVAVLPDGRRFISASADHTLKLWSLEG
ncbi:MAG: NB-ARC domain-containing protein [Candidatus Competibacteraceae bacterium]